MRKKIIIAGIILNCLTYSSIGLLYKGIEIGEQNTFMQGVVRLERVREAMQQWKDEADQEQKQAQRAEPKTKKKIANKAPEKKGDLMAFMENLK